MTINKLFTGKPFKFAEGRGSADDSSILHFAKLGETLPRYKRKCVCVLSPLDGLIAFFFFNETYWSKLSV